MRKFLTIALSVLKSDWFAAYRRHRYEKRLAGAKAMLRSMVAAKDPEVYHEIRAIADILARSMCMVWLDNRRVNHCKECPNTGQLINIDGSYWCAPHAQSYENRKKTLVEKPDLHVDNVKASPPPVFVVSK